MSDIDSVTSKKLLFFTRYQIDLKRIRVPITLYGKFGEAVLKEWETSGSH